MVATKQANKQSRWMTVAEFAEDTQISEYTVYELIRLGKFALPTQKIGRHVRIDRRAYEAMGQTLDRKATA